MLLIRAEKALQRCQFCAVAKRRAGGMAFDVINLFRLHAGAGIGALIGQSLAIGIGDKHMLTSAVIGQTDTFNDRKDHVIVAQRIFQPPQHDNAGALTRDDTIRRAVEGLADAIVGKSAEIAEGNMDQPGIRQANAPASMASA